jgi:SAM-dependent methyltransferase
MLYRREVSISGRSNMVKRRDESWRPPLFRASNSLLSRLTFALRRIFDLQTSSIWHDLSVELPGVDGRAVDVGCGAQPYRCLFSADAEYIGIDTADAKSHFGYSMPDTRYFEGTIWPVADASVNFLLCTETLEHVLDFEGFLHEAARCLVPGGRILLTVPFSARWHYIPYDYWRFTPSSLDSLLSRAGFVDIAVYARGNAVTVACYKTMALILLLLMPQGRSRPAGMALRLVGLPFLPLFLVLGIIGNLSLLGRGGDDCLGYTALATKSGQGGASG